jgi:UDP-galactopyranose mutase
MHAPDLLCFSHLRWNFVFQRPNHLMNRCAATRSVLYIEEPLFDTQYNRAEVAPVSTNLWRLVPHLSSGLTESAQAVAVREMIASTSAGPSTGSIRP